MTDPITLGTSAQPGGRDHTARISLNDLVLTDWEGIIGKFENGKVWDAPEKVFLSLRKPGDPGPGVVLDLDPTQVSFTILWLFRYLAWGARENKALREALIATTEGFSEFKEEFEDTILTELQANLMEANPISQ